MKELVAQSQTTLCNPMSRILEWTAISFSRGSSWSRDQTQVSCIAGGLFTIWATRSFLLLLHAKLLQSSPTLCDPMGRSPPGSSMRFPRQEYWSGLPCCPPVGLTDSRIEPVPHIYLHWQEVSLLLAPSGKPPNYICVCVSSSVVSDSLRPHGL